MPHVLIIDSEAPVADSIKASLESRGATVHVTGDGAQGLEYARGNAVDAIVLCVELNRGSGYSVCNKLKKDAQLSTVPLVLTSSQATEETFEQHKKLRTRAEAYLRKPFEGSVLVATLSEFISLGGGAEDSEMEVSAGDLTVDGEDDEFLDMNLEAEAGVDDDDPLGGLELGGDEDDESDDELVLGAPDVDPAPQSQPDSVVDAAARRSTGSLVNDAELESARGEVRQLRQRVQKLERALHDKEVEFNDRLLEESGRARDGLDAKQKLAKLEREMSKYQQIAERAQKETDELHAEVREQKSQVAALDEEREVLSEKLGQLVDKVKAVAAERDELRAEIDRAKSDTEAVADAEETARKVREKARKAVDIAVQLIGETGLIH